MNGNNQYDAGKHGKQDAKKFARFKKLPPVLQVSLKRYIYDYDLDERIKVNQRFEFSDILDLETILDT